MIPIVSPIELKNVGGTKLKIILDESDEINKYNAKNDDFPIFSLDFPENSIGPGDTKYIIGSFRPLTSKNYRVEVPVIYKDEVTGFVGNTKIILTGVGFHPLNIKLPPYISYYENMPKARIDNIYENTIIQKCGVSLEELDFGDMEDKAASQTFIIYNYSMTNSLDFEFYNPGFNMKDEIVFEPNNGNLEPNSHLLIKVRLVPKTLMSNYEGEIEIKINWNIVNESAYKVIEKESLFIRMLKKSVIKDVNTFLN
jgi:hypothetical protein